MRKLTEQQMKELRAKGKLTIKKPADTKKAPEGAKMSEKGPKAPPADAGVATAIDRQAQATANLAQTLGEGQMKLVKQLETVLIANQKEGVKPIPYRFKITRNRRGLMEYVDAYPLTEDSE